LKKFVLGAACVYLIAGCATAPIPKDYSGPLATIQDTARSETGSRAQFYYLSEIDGRRVANVLGETRKANAGRGFSLSPVEYRRDLPAQPSKLKIEARVGYGAPIQEMLNAATLYSTERTITVKLESNKNYVVKGVLTAEKQEVWLEEQGTGARVE
jgi:hypothetical protein